MLQKRTCEKWSLVCSENGDFQKHLKKPIPVTTFEVYRFSHWFYKNSIRWLLPKKCITSLLILTFLKFNDQFVPYEKSARRCPSLKILQDAPKRSARLSNFWRVCVLSSAKNGHWSAAKMVIFKNIKKSLYQWQLLKSIVSVFGFIKKTQGFWGRTRVFGDERAFVAYT